RFSCLAEGVRLCPPFSQDFVLHSGDVYCGAMKVVFTILIFAAALSGQTARPSFEVASTRPAVDAQPQAVTAAGRVDGAQFKIGGLTFKDYVGMAYGLKLNQISGPDWITTDRFDIVAALPEGSSPDQVPMMMQSLL